MGLKNWVKFPGNWLYVCFFEDFLVFKIINKKMAVALFFVVGGYSTATVCSVSTCDSIAASRKECDKKESFVVAADVGQFTKSDLKHIPFGCKRREEYEETYFLVEKETEIPGGLVSFTVEHESATLEKLGVCEDLQKKGHGTRLVNHVLTVLKARGIKMVSLVPTPDAGSFYRKNGFVFGKMGYLERNL